MWEHYSDDENLAEPPTPPTPPTPPPLESSSPSTKPPSPPPLRRSKRTQTHPSWMADYVTPLANSTTTCLHPEFKCFMAQIHQPLTLSHFMR